MKNCIIIGAGAYGQVYLHYLSKVYNVSGFFDSNSSLTGTKIYDYPVLGNMNEVQAYIKEHPETSIFVPLGDNKRRVELLQYYEQQGYDLPSFVHESVYLNDQVILGKSVYILPSTNIMPFTTIGSYTMISMGVNIAHHVSIAEGCFFSQGCNIGASINIGKKAYFGMSAAVMTGVEHIGDGALLGAGAMVIRDVPTKAVIVGNPGKILRHA